MTRIWLIRHGEPAEQVKDRCYGSLDIGLSDKGRHQMAEAAQHLKAESASVIYTSPSARALESARILTTTQSCLLETIPDFREINFGGFEGLTYDEVAARYPNLYRQWMETPTEIRFPNGENFNEMQTRVLCAFETILRGREGQTVMIVSHGGVNRILIAWALQMPAASIFCLAQDYAAVNLISFTGGTPCLQLLNYRAPFL
jgi:alpha-ribazole phosphatase